MSDRLYDNRGASHDCTPSCRGAGPQYRTPPRSLDFILKHEKPTKVKKKAKKRTKKRREALLVCPHLKTTIIDDKKYCLDCGEEVKDV